MSRLLVAILIIFLLVGGGIAYLVLADIPAPQKPVEKVLENERFLKP